VQKCNYWAFGGIFITLKPFISNQNLWHFFSKFLENFTLLRKLHATFKKLYPFNPLTPSAPFYGVQMRMQGDEEHLKSIFHPYFSLLPFHVAKDGSQNMLFLVYFGKLFLLALNLKFLHKRDIL